MVNVTANKEMWAPPPRIAPPESWAERTEHYLAAGSGIAEPAGNGSKFTGEPAIPQGFISELNRLYEFRGGLVVENFLQENLRENEHLGGLLLEAYEVIREHFHLGTRLALEVVADPEALGDQQLLVVIRTRFRPKIAHALLSELDRGWWLDALPATHGKMELSLEYI